MVGVVTLGLSAFSSEADARSRKRGGGYNPPFAAMVVDAKTGRTLYAQNENALRHPASITKVMTLYMLFEQLERGRLQLDSSLQVSARAASQAPSKLGLRPGSTIEVEDAIMALVTKSANDVAVVVAENLGGSESAFADQMTRKARSLGMSRTVFQNASGLPDADQVTTARDLIVLARALQDRFPQYYHYFGSRAFTFAGRVHRNHNKLLGRVEGVDGIKTGYTRMSGFNLMTSAKSDGQHVVAVVLGGRSGASRDQIMANLVENHLPRAFAGRRSAPVVAEAENARNDGEDNPAPTPVSYRTNPSVVAELVPHQTNPAPKPLPVRPRPAVVAELVQSRTTNDAVADMTASTASGAKRPSREPLDIASLKSATAYTAASTVTPSSIARTPAGQQVASLGPVPLPVASPNRNVTSAATTRKSEPKDSEAKAPEKTSASPASSSSKPSVSGWVIQLGATDDEGKARDILDRAKAKSKGALAKAKPFTEKVVKDGSTLYRARFSGFAESDDADTACKSLKRNGFACFASRS